MTGRLRLTKRERAAMKKRQGGVCIGCGRTEEEAGPFHEEHTIPNYFVPGKPDALMCASCHSPKTAIDAGDIARCKRRKAKHEGTYRRGKPIPARGFDTRYKRKIGGKVEVRHDTGS